MSRLVLILCIVAFPFSARARAPHPATLDLLVMEMASDDSKQSQLAENQLSSLARTHPDAVCEWLRRRLGGETNPVIKSRLERVLLRVENAQLLAKPGIKSNAKPVPHVSNGNPLTQIKFTEEAFKNKVWEIQGEAPQKSRYFFNERVLEIHSTEDVKEGVSFVHQFEKPPLTRRSFTLRSENEPKPESYQRLVLDAEIKVIKERHVRSGLAGVHMNLEDGRTSAGLMILEDGIFAYRHSHVHPMNTTDGWHHYRFVIEGENQQVFVDDMKTPVITLKRENSPGRYWATFGDGTAGAGTIAQFRNVSVSRYAADVKG